MPLYVQGYANQGVVYLLQIADFWREACTLSQLHHPNVVAFYGVVRDGPGGTLATVTEYMVNGSLKQVLQKKDRFCLVNTFFLSLDVLLFAYLVVPVSVFMQKC